MFCNQCGASVADNATSCTACGSPVRVAAPAAAVALPRAVFCRNCGKQISPVAAVCTACGVATGSGMVVTAGVPFDPQAKSKLAAGLLGIFLGGFGVHRFYLGYVGLGIVQVLVTLATCGFGSMWGLIEGILILAGSSIRADATGRPLRE